IRTQRNFRIHSLLALAAVAAALVAGLGAVEWAVLILTIAFVVIAEGLNTGIELAVSLASPERTPEAKAAKDIAAGMVLLAAVASVLPLENVMREDELRGSLPVEAVLAQAPDREGDLFRVQASLEERPDA